MITSGSTGNAKAVRLTHGQILASIESKGRAHFTNRHPTFLNWIGFDHVACLTENHLHNAVGWREAGDGAGGRYCAEPAGVFESGE